MKQLGYDPRFLEDECFPKTCFSIRGSDYTMTENRVNATDKSALVRTIYLFPRLFSNIIFSKRFVSIPLGHGVRAHSCSIMYLSMFDRLQYASYGLHATGSIDKLQVAEDTSYRLWATSIRQQATGCRFSTYTLQATG